MRYANHLSSTELVILVALTKASHPSLARLCRAMVATYDIQEEHPCDLFEQIESRLQKARKCNTLGQVMQQVSENLTLEEADLLAKWVSRHKQSDEAPCGHCETLQGVYMAPSASQSLFFQHVITHGHPAIFPENLNLPHADYQTVKDQLHSIYLKHGSPNLTSSDKAYAPFFFRTDYQDVEKFCELSRLETPKYLGWTEFRPQVTRLLEALIGNRRPRVIPDMLWDGTAAQRWVFVGSPGHGKGMHTDRVVDHGTWHIQLVGSKTWQLNPLPPCTKICSNLKFTVHPGQVFVFDSNKWRHSTHCSTAQQNGTTSPCINIAGDFYSPLCPKFLAKTHDSIP